MAETSDIVPSEQEQSNVGADSRSYERRRIARNLETAIEFLTASPPMGPTLIKPAGMMLFFTGADTFWLIV